jgi:hypothetical protein
MSEYKPTCMTYLQRAEPLFQKLTRGSTIQTLAGWEERNSSHLASLNPTSLNKAANSTSQQVTLIRTV